MILNILRRFYILKIEKLTENKIRIIMKQEDLKDPSLDLHTILTQSPESQKLFLEILDKAKKECNFNIDGHKLLIEAFSSSEDFVVFTITKYAVDKIDKSSLPTYSPSPKNLKVKRKVNILPKTDFSVYCFDDFEEFCSFCSAIKNNSNISTYGLVHSSSLYSYENNFYIVLSGINLKHKSLSKFYSLMSEFATFCTHSDNFESKLKEYGKCIMKKNAISTTMKHFL